MTTEIKFRKIMRNIKAYIYLSIAALCVAFCAYTLFVYIPFSLYYKAKCLEEGYPEASVSIGLSGYCLNPGGKVVVKVDNI